MNAFAGTGSLLRLILRRDRVVAPLWTVLLGLAPLLYAASFQNLYPTAADRQAFYLGTLDTEAEAALVGPIFGSDLGALIAWRAGLLLTLVPLAAIVTVIRHTRSEEDAGRTELIGSSAVGRHAGLAAAMSMAGGAVVVTGLLSGISLWVYGLPAAGSLAFGLSLAVVGLVFGGVAALSAQLTAGARAARGNALGVLAAAFVLRALGDAGSGVLSWVSPIGWSAQMRPFAVERWWPALLSVSAASLALAAAFAIADRRDLGSGVFSQRPGRAGALPGLSGPVSLGWRLSRATTLGWTVGLGLFGVAIGSAANGIESQLGSSAAVTDALRNFGGSTATQSFLAAVLSIVGIVVTAYAVAAVLRLHSEEDAGHAEMVLATAVSRGRWMAGALVPAAFGSAWLLAVCGLTIGVSYGLAAGEGAAAVPSILGGAMAQLPAVWLVAAIGVAAFGIVPQLSASVWAVLAGFVTLGQVGAVLGWPQWLLDVSPFTHLPRLPGGVVSVTPLLTVTAVAIVIAAVGVGQAHRRDL